MPNHLTPTELAREIGLDRREVISKCMEMGVPIFQSKIDKTLFLTMLEAEEHVAAGDRVAAHGPAWMDRPRERTFAERALAADPYGRHAEISNADADQHAAAPDQAAAHLVLFDSSGNMIDSFQSSDDAARAVHSIGEADEGNREHFKVVAYDANGDVIVPASPAPAG